MSRIAAIDFGPDEIVLIAAESGEDNMINLVEIFKLPTSSIFGDSSEDSSEDTPEEQDSEEPEEQTEPAKINEDRYTLTAEASEIREFIHSEVDSSLAIVSSSSILYQDINLPFDDNKKIDQTAPLQIQDKVPLDIDDFFVDSVILDKNPNGGFDILSSVVPSADIANTLGDLKTIGSDPKLLTTKASALTALRDLLVHKLSGSFAILEVSLNTASLAIFVDDKLVRLKDIPYAVSNNGNPDIQLLSSSTIQDINCTLMATDSQHKANVSRVWLVAPPSIARQCQEQLTKRAENLDISSVITNKTPHNLKIDEISWALGLAATELGASKGTTSKLIDFRSGPFAHKQLWRNLYDSLKEEIFFIGLAIFFCVGWFGSEVYLVSSTLDQVESRIKETIEVNLPGESIPFRREVSTLEEKIDELEEQLRGMGSLSSLSPLDSLNELSSVIGPNIDIQIEVLNIAESKMSFRGSVADTPTVGRLSSALENNNKRFCEVKVDPKGKLPGSSRVRYSAEIVLCE